MATQVQLRRGSAAENAQFTGAVGEVTVNTDSNTLIVHDGVTRGGAREIGKDVTPVDITFTGDVTGKITDFDMSGDVTVNLTNNAEPPTLNPVNITFTGDVTGSLQNFDMSKNVSVTLRVAESVLAGAGGGSGSSGSGGQSFQFYKSEDGMFGYFGSKAGATCAYGQDTITVTLPADCTVLSMYFCQDEEFITKTQCTINFDSTNVMTEAGVTFDVEDLASLCGITPYVQVFKIASNGLQDSRVGVSQVNTGTNTVLMQGLPMGDARVFKLIF